MQRADVRLIERHAVRAWPAPITRSVDGWLLRRTPGMRRLRSGNTALPPENDGPPGPALARAEEFYSEHGLPTVVQVSPSALHPALDEHLAARGYLLDSPIHVLTAAAETVARQPDRDGWTATIEPAPTEAWSAAFVDLDGQDDSRALADQVISAIALPRACVSISTEQRVAGIGLLVGGDEGWAGVYCMATHPEHRRRGVAAAVLRAGADWALKNGVPGLYLQVAADNPAARNLYARNGFTHHYDYHYRRAAR